MRRLLALLVLLSLPLAALAQTTSPETAHHRMTWQQHFEKANVTHDGHLTMEQARAGYPTLARHFAAIDQDHKGYVTEDDIRAYNKAQHALHHQSAELND
jgi:hypothetical protein